MNKAARQIESQTDRSYCKITPSEIEKESLI